MSDYDDDFEKEESNPAITPQKEDKDNTGMSWLNPQERPRSKIDMSDKGSSRAPSSRAPSSSSRISSPVSKTSRSSSVRSSSAIASTPAASPAGSPAKKTAASPTKPVAKASSPTRAPRVAKPAPVEPVAVKAPPRRTLDADRKSKAEAARAMLPVRGERSRSKPAVSKSSAPAQSEAMPQITKQPPAPKAAPTAKDLATLQLKNIDLETTIAQIRDQLNLLAPQVIHPRKTMSASDSDRVTKLQREAKMLQAEQEMLQRKIDGASNVSKVQSYIEVKEKEIKDVKERNKWLAREIRLNSRKLKGGHGVTSVNGGHETNVSIDQQKARLAEECKTEAAVWTNTLERSKVEAESAVESRERLEQSVEALTVSDKAPNLWKVSDARQVIELHEKIQAKLESCETLRQRLRSAESAKAAAAAEAAESDHLPKNSEVDELRKQVAALRNKIAKEQQASVSRSPTKSMKKAPPKPLTDSGAPGPIAGRRARAAKEAASVQGDVTPKKPIPVIAKKVAAAKPVKGKEAPAPAAQPSPAPPSPAASPKSSRASTPSPKSSRASSPIPSSEPTPMKHDDTPTKPEEKSHTPPRSPTPKSSKVSSAAHSQVSSRKSSFRDVPEKADSRPVTPPSKPATPVKSASKPSTPVVERKSSTTASNHAAPVTMAAVEPVTKDEVVDEEQEEVVNEEVVDEAPKEEEEPSWL